MLSLSLSFFSFPQDTSSACQDRVLFDKTIEQSLFISYSYTVLKDLLRFATGSMALPSSRKIDMKFDVTDGCIFTSTCTMELRLPVKFDSYKRFEEALKIVISRDEKKSFNAM